MARCKRIGRLQLVRFTINADVIEAYTEKNDPNETKKSGTGRTAKSTWNDKNSERNANEFGGIIKSLRADDNFVGVLDGCSAIRWRRVKRQFFLIEI